MKPLSKLPKTDLSNSGGISDVCSGDCLAPNAANDLDHISTKENEATAALDSLLARVAPVTVSAGFADRVIHAVQTTDCLPLPSRWLQWRHKALAAAASVALCAGLAFWKSAPHGAAQTGAPSEEELLLKALTTLDVSSEDLALVAQLGEVLEAELSERNSWLEKE